MAAKDKQEKSTKDKKSNKKARRFIIILITIFIIGLIFWRFFLYKTVDECLAAIEAARAIPDSENAAVSYRTFFSDSNNILALKDLSSYAVSSSAEPWHNSEYPELAEKLETHSRFMQTLLNISDIPKASFKIYPDPLIDWYDMSPSIRKVAFILSWAAANDMAEGRIDEAIAKYRCKIRIASHLQQQPLSSYSLIGIGIEGVGHSNIRALAMHSNISEVQLNQLDTILEIIRNNPEPDQKTVNKIERLLAKKQSSTLSSFERLKAWLQYILSDNTSIEQLHTRLVSGRRGTEIVVALRRYKDKNGPWPENLDEIKTFVAEDTLTDPLNNGPFIYKLIDDGFVLYSKGLNNIDENGQRRDGADDYPIWPKLIPQINTNPDTNEEPAQ